MSKLIFMLIILSASTVLLMEIPDVCPEIKFNDIPNDHLFHKKEKPLIIAHRGLPRQYQENTYDGIISSLDSGADGFELDIYKTKDNKLVVFHDDNTKRMTGESLIIYNSTFEELQRLNITDSLTAGGKNFTYDKKRKIPLLEDILKITSKKDVIHYLEMKPSDAFRPHEVQLAKETARLLAEMVSSFHIEMKAIIVSFDFRKVKYVKEANPNITVGTLFSPKSSTVPKGKYLEIQNLGSLRDCLRNGPDETFAFFQFILESGILFKYSGSSSFDSNIKLYDNPKYSNSTLQMLRKEYGNNISTGFYTLYSMGHKEEQNVMNEKKVIKLIADGGGNRIITDDIIRARNLIGRISTAVSTRQSILFTFFMIFSSLFIISYY